ncbi:TadE/TadG family type IV pilus assembly protein [Methylobacterium brachythecii]|uniref:Flp pilus assembly protein TadG n=1 Tax=Methylobacterium brachythecii TaxID=1176177 RepID=A0A7W6AL52_9HYPH|nr:TadE/TadG family type IV pilus assembly protein [Methylobacterium brachythecii]MBB3903225.1 Flp pilus assembly protein TadG [Methylobacterium brachythecii]GLS46003.1 pilus biosynthesis protein TadE [Methylobacterium brachythecii]
MSGLVRRFRRNQSGVGAVEFALILPTMLFAILGSFQIFALARARMLTVAATRNLADLVSQQDSVTPTQIADFCKAGKFSLLPLASASFKASIASVTYSNNVRKIDWTDVSCGAVTAIANAATTAASVTQAAGDTAIVVSASYTYTSPITFPLTLNVTFASTALSRPRLGTAVTYGT